MKRGEGESTTWLRETWENLSKITAFIRPPLIIHVRDRSEQSGSLVRDLPQLPLC